MKKLLIAFIVLFGVYQLNAQEVLVLQDGYHKHDGFYLSMNTGPVFGNVFSNDKSYSSPNTMDMSGPGAVIDFKIGGAIRENLILHADIISNAVVGPTIISTGNINPPKVKAPQTLSVGEEMYGVGITYYIMPSNILLSGTLGLGSFSIIDSKNDNNNVITDRGFSMQLKLGKEWWVSKNWGLGVGLTYGSTNVTNKPDNGSTEEISSNRFGILFNTTFN